MKYSDEEWSKYVLGRDLSLLEERMLIYILEAKPEYITATKMVSHLYSRGNMTDDEWDNKRNAIQKAIPSLIRKLGDEIEWRKDEKRHIYIDTSKIAAKLDKKDIPVEVVEDVELRETMEQLSHIPVVFFG